MATNLARALEQNRPLDDPNILKEDDPPMLRFERSTLENRHETVKTGTFSYKDATFVHVRSYGDTKTEVPYVVKTTIMVPSYEDVIVRKKVPVLVRTQDPETGVTSEKTEYEERDTLEKQETFTEETIYPWFVQLDERLRNGRITQSYRDYCRSYYEKWEETGEVPIDGIPVKEWSMIGEAERHRLLDAGFNTVERVAEMNEDSMELIGLGARELKKKATTFLTAHLDVNRSAAKVLALENRIEQQAQGYEAKMAELQQMIDNYKADDEPKSFIQKMMPGPGRGHKGPMDDKTE